MLCIRYLLIAGVMLALASPAQTESHFGVGNTHKSSNEQSQYISNSLQAAYLNLPLSFEANQGQTDPQVAFLSRGSGYTLFLTDSEAVVALSKSDSRSVLRMILLGASTGSKATGIGKLPGKTNYFIGNDPGKWRTHIPSYQKVKYSDVYPGVDLVYYGNQHQLEYDFIVAPGADPGRIKLKFDGAQRLHIDENGDLVLSLSTAGDEVRFRAPVTYQKSDSGRQVVASRYFISASDEVGFTIGPYDSGRPLIIDPVLSYSTYLGGADYEYGYAVAIDSTGKAYVTGSTQSSDFPYTSGVHDTSLGGTSDAFVSKFDPTLSGAASLIYSTYLGGDDGGELGQGIAVDASGNAYVGGQTGSSNFPTQNAYDGSLGGSSDAFFTKLNASGTALIYSTYLGGGAVEYGNALAIDSSNNAYLTGYTTSNDFPTQNAYDSSLGSTQDVFVTKINPALSGAASLIYSTYLGGDNSYETGYGIAVDSANQACVTGYTFSNDFPTQNAYDSSYNGSNEVFVTQLSSSGNSLVYSTYLGSATSTISDYGYGIALDDSDDIYVTGYTRGTDFPTKNAYDTTRGGTQDAFVAKFDPSLSGAASLIYSTYLGGGDLDHGYGIFVDADGNAIVTGYTDSDDFPTTADAYDDTRNARDVFIAKITADGSDLAYGTFLGGTDSDTGRAIIVDSDDFAYLAGQTDSGNFPTQNAYDTSLGGTRDAFFVKLLIGAAPTISSAVNQIFATGDSATAISAITVTDDPNSPVITAANDIRIRIPAGFNMSWDNTDTEATIGGGASGKVSTTVTFEDSDKTLVINVGTDFAASDQITISDLSFKSFTAASAADNLELEVDNDDTVAAVDDKTVTILEPDIGIDCDFSDWCDGDGTEYCVDDEGGADDWTNPAKLDITRFGVASNISDSLFILFGFDDTVFPQAAQAATLIDTDLDDNINYLVEAMVSGSGDTVKLYSCDDTLPTQCGNPTLSQTYSNPADYCRGTATGPWDSDTFVEVKVPYSHLGVSGGDILLTTMYSYNPGQFDNPKDSIYGTTEQDYDDRVQYDTGNGDGDDIPEAGTPSFAGTVYSDEGTTPIGAGTTVRLLVNGVVAGSDTTSVYGDYFIVAAAGAGDAILVYVDDGAPYGGTSVSVFGGNNLSDLDIYDDHLITRHDNSGSLSIANMDTAKGGLTDSDILYDVSGGSLNVTGSGTELYLPSGHSFTPGGDVTTPGMKSLGTFAGGSGAIDINGTLTIGGGAFTATSGTLSVSGNFAHSAGTFTHNSGTVILDGSAQSISGSTTFNHFTKSVATAETLTFEAGSTQTFDGTVTLQGADSNLLALRSSSGGSQWGFTLNASATKALSYLDVQDSDASGSDESHKFLNPSDSIDSCNNIDWFPSPAPEAGITAALSPTRDTFIEANAATTNHGTCTSLTIDRESGDLHRALFYFDLSSIPAEAIITAATLELTASTGADMNVGVYRMTADWDEGSQCGATGQASWDDRQPSTPWGVAGGDYDGTAVDTVGSIATGLNTWNVQSLVEDWVDGTYSNFGVMVGSPDGGGSREAVFYSREDTTPDNRPILRITYTEEGPYIFSDANQSFAVGDPATAISTITIIDDATTPTITAADDIRIRIPDGFNMVWDTADTTASICGGAAGKVSTTVSYEDSDKTLVIDVTTDFAASDYITISDLSFTSFTAASALDYLELEVENDDLIQDTDDKFIFIIDDLSISSASYQAFFVGDPPTAISTITITDNSSTAFITDADDIRIRLPADVHMLWYTSDTTATIGGGAAA
ncbi:MAG: SBBP repeat-containing protein, partial [Desulfobacterales bacterium]